MYAGTTVEITNAATDFDGSVLTPTQVGAVTVVIHDAAGAVVLASTDMDWDDPRQLWAYLWQTDTTPTGTYTAKVTMVGVDGTESWEFLTIRLKKNKF